MRNIILPIIMVLISTLLLDANELLLRNMTPPSGIDPIPKTIIGPGLVIAHTINTNIEICFYNGLSEKLNALDLLRLSSPILDTIFYNDNNCIEIEMDLSLGHEWTIVADSLGFRNGMDGINIIDLIAIFRDLLDKSPFPNRLAKIAGMFANSSGTSSITHLSRAILGYPENIHHAQWILIDSTLNYPFINSAGGVSHYAPTINSSFLPTELFALKSGDVNFSELTGENTEGLLNISIQDEIVNLGEVYAIPIIVSEDVEIDGLQIEFNKFDSFIDHIPSEFDTPFSYMHSSPELNTYEDKFVLLSYFNEPSKGVLSEGDTLLIFNFRALKNGVLSEMLSLYPGENNLAVMPVGQLPKKLVIDWKDRIINNNVQEIELEKISLFPNPASDYLEIKGITSTINYQITDLLGRVCYSGNVPEDVRLNVENLSNGMYVITMMNAAGARKSFKFFVTH